MRSQAPYGPSRAPFSGYDQPMFRRLRTPLLLVAVLAVAFPGTAAETHPFSIHDMLAMDRISDAQVSPDGTQAAFVLRTTDLAANRGRTDLWLLDVRTKAVRRLTTHEAGDSSPRWAADGKSLFFLSTRSGSQQVWNLPLAGGEAEKVTSEPLDVDNMEVAPGGKLLVLSMEVFPGKSPVETKKMLDDKGALKASGMLFDRLFVRHWDTWKDGRRNHVFVLPLGADGKAAGPAKDLMPQMDADAPTKPFGGLDETAVTADAKKLVFTCKDVGREEAWSTNYDLWEVPTDGSAAPKRITTNPAWDATPALLARRQDPRVPRHEPRRLRGRPVRGRPPRSRDGQGPFVHAPRGDREERRPLAGRDHLVRRREVALRDRGPSRPEGPLRDRRRQRQGEDPRRRRLDRRPAAARKGPDPLLPPLAPRADRALRDPGRRRRVREADDGQRREGRRGPLRQARAVQLQGRQGRHRLRLHRPPRRLRPGEEVPASRS